MRGRPAPRHAHLARSAPRAPCCGWSAGREQRRTAQRPTACDDARGGVRGAGRPPQAAGQVRGNLACLGSQPAPEGIVCLVCVATRRVVGCLLPGAQLRCTAPFRPRLHRGSGGPLARCSRTPPPAHPRPRRQPRPHVDRRPRPPPPRACRRRRPQRRAGAPRGRAQPQPALRGPHSHQVRAWRTHRLGSKGRELPIKCRAKGGRRSASGPPGQDPVISRRATSASEQSPCTACALRPRSPPARAAANTRRTAASKLAEPRHLERLPNATPLAQIAHASSTALLNPTV